MTAAVIDREKTRRVRTDFQPSVLDATVRAEDGVGGRGSRTGDLNRA